MQRAEKPDTKSKCEDNIKMGRKMAGCEGNVLPFHDTINVDHIPFNFLFISPNAACEGLATSASCLEGPGFKSWPEN